MIIVKMGEFRTVSIFYFFKYNIGILWPQTISSWLLFILKLAIEIVITNKAKTQMINDFSEILIGWWVWWFFALYLGYAYDP